MMFWIRTNPGDFSIDTGLYDVSPVSPAPTTRKIRRRRWVRSGTVWHRPNLTVRSKHSCGRAFH